MKKRLRRSDIAPLTLLCLSWLLILIIWGVNAIPRTTPSGPEVNVTQIKKEIREAGLEPREASYYRILPQDQGEK